MNRIVETTAMEVNAKKPHGRTAANRNQCKAFLSWFNLGRTTANHTKRGWKIIY